ncbi:MAG: efflux transporter outer membrane subunit [Planctomycetota bacterium]|jgi:NodT family efflux transporter outer membrane factor (OMF) lipoprotein
MRYTLASMLLVAGCGLTREPRTAELPVQPRSSWAATEAAKEYAVTEDWWKEFGDSQMDEYILEALLANPTLKEAEARVQQAAALAKIAGAELYPWVGAGASGGRRKQFLGIAGIPDPTFTQGAYGVELNLSWELDVWGRIRAGKRAALEDLRTSQALFHGAQLSLAAQTAKAYFASVAGALQVQVAKEDLASALSLKERIRERFQRGLRTALDLKLAETEVSRAQATLAVRQRVLDTVLRQLETLMGRYPVGLAEYAEALPQIPAPVPAGIPADVLARRPDLVAAERRVVAAADRIVEANASLYPRISLTASGGLASSDMEDVIKGDFSVWSLVGNLSQPIFQGGQLRANVELTKAREEEAVASFGNAVLGAFREVEVGLVSERHLTDQENAVGRLVADAESSVELSEQRYLTGLASILNVLEARRRFFIARAEHLNARQERLDTRIDLYVALGGGFEKSLIGLDAEEEKS